jgi:hypothetical protein
MRVLITARDAGAARQNLAFAENCLEQNRVVEFMGLVEGPAIDLFKHVKFTHTCFDCQSNNKQRSAIGDITQIINEFKPDFVMVGLSFLGEGIDELVRQLCQRKNIKCGVIQDYWGYLGGFDIKSLPDIFFVLDQEANHLTTQKTNNSANCIISGSPKHEAYKNKLDIWMAQKPLEYHEDKSIVFIGQPSEIAGIFDNFKIFVSALKHVQGSFKIFYKPHPADMAYLPQYEKVLASQKKNYEIIDNNVDVEAVLCQADIVVTCFSTSGLDHNYLQLYAAHPLGELVYLTVGKELLGFIEQVVGIANIPGAKSGMGTVCNSKEELKITLQKFLQESSSNYSEKVQNCLGMKNSPTETILNYIRALV